jgi:hypothetical protein
MNDHQTRLAARASAIDAAVEQIVCIINIVARRRALILAALAAAVPLAISILVLAPQEYVANAIVLTQPANQSPLSGQAPGPHRQAATDQLRVIEAWLKSDHVFGALLPDLLDGDVPTDARARSIVMTKLRKSLEFEMIGDSVIEVRLRGDRAEGLGKKLEVILTQFVEGMIQPDSGVLSASQLIALHRRDAVRDATARFGAELKAAGLSDSPALRAGLHSLDALVQEHDELARRIKGAARGKVGSAASPAATEASSARELSALGQRIAATRATLAVRETDLRGVEAAYRSLIEAQAAMDAINRVRPTPAVNHLGIFASPERLTIAGRPKDPVVGKASGTKYLAALLLFMMLGTAALIAFLEVLERRLKVRQDFEDIAGIPVIARLPRTG